MDNQQIKLLFKERYNLVVGNRVIKRIQSIINLVEIDNYTDDGIRTVAFLCQDIKYAFPNESRSKKVMAYRKADKQLKLIGMAAAYGGPEVINNLGRKMLDQINNFRVEDARAVALGIVSTGIN